MLRRLTMFIILGALLAGCGKATPWPGYGPEGKTSQAGQTGTPPVTTPNPTPTTPQPSAGGMLPQDSTIPGDNKALEAALSAPSTLSYKIEIVNEPVADPSKYLDDRLATAPPGANEVLFVLFAANGWNLYFGLGPMSSPLSADKLFAQVKTYYQPKAKAGDPAGGMADLIGALNHG